MVKGCDTPMPTRWTRQFQCIRSCKNIDHDALDFAPCMEGRRESPLIGECKAEFTRMYLVRKLSYCHQSLFIPPS